MKTCTSLSCVCNPDSKKEDRTLFPCKECKDKMYPWVEFRFIPKEDNRPRQSSDLEKAAQIIANAIMGLK